jgi:hypothetical protein
MLQTNTTLNQREPIATGLPRSIPLLPSLFLTASVIVLGWRFFRFIWKYSVNVLYWDQWGYLNSFFGQSPRIKELFFKQWGPHREGIGLIPDMILYPLTKWNTRAESLMIGGIIFLAMIVALRVKSKLFGPFTYSDVGIPLMFLNMGQWEVLTGTPNPAHSAFPLLLVLLYCLALLMRRKVLKYACLLLLNFFLIYTGFGIFMGLITLGVFALETSLHWQSRIEGSVALPLTGFLLAGASLGSFFIHYTFWPAVDCFVFPYHPAIAYAHFMALMPWGFIGYSHWATLGTVVGAVMLLSVLVAFAAELRAFFRSDRLRDSHMVRLVLLGFSVLFVANTAVGRVCLGRDAALSSRYLTLLIPAFLAVYFYLLPFTAKPAGKVVLGLFVIALIPSAVMVRPSARRQTDGKRAWAACYLQTENIAYCDNATNFKVDPYPDYNHLKEKLDYLRQHQLNLFAGTSK